MKHILELKGISKHYGKVHALKNVELTLDHGIYALLGPNGSGKSTLFSTSLQRGLTQSNV